MKNNLFFVLFVITILFLSCDNGVVDNGGSILSFIDITNASNLFISEVDSPQSNSLRAVKQKKMFKITGQGHIEEVSYLNDNGQEISTTLEPIKIYNVNEAFVIVIFNDSSGYLVRKTDGAVFSLENAGVPYYHQLQSGNFINAQPIQTDSSGNMYYQSSNTGAVDGVYVAKIDISDPESMVKTQVTPDTDSVSGFNVSPEGHITYVYGDGSLNRIRKSNGGLYNLPSIAGLLSWVGLDGNIKYQDMDGTLNIITTVTIDEIDFTVSTSDATVNIGTIQSSSSYLFKFADRTIAIETLYDQIYELENPIDNPRTVRISEISDIRLAYASENFYYLFGNDDSNNPLLLKIDPNDDTVTTIIATGLYDIYKMTVSAEDEIVFNALRMQDGQKVIGRVSSNGVVTIVDESLNYETVILERIN